MNCQRCNSQMVGNSFKRDRYSYFDYSQELMCVSLKCSFVNYYKLSLTNEYNSDSFNINYFYHIFDSKKTINSITSSIDSNSYFHVALKDGPQALYLYKGDENDFAKMLRKIKYEFDFSNLKINKKIFNYLKKDGITISSINLIKNFSLLD